MYKQDTSIVKQATRDIVLREALWGRKKLNRVITLCNKNFYIENKLLQLNPQCIIQSFEYDARVYKAALKTKPRQVKLLNQNIFQYDFTNVYPDFIWLDLCNSYTEEIINKIVEFINKQLFVKNSTLIITLNKGRGVAGNKLFYNEFYTNYKTRGVLNHLGNFIQVRGGGQVVEMKTLEYTCFDVATQGHSAPMIALIFKMK